MQDEKQVKLKERREGNEERKGKNERTKKGNMEEKSSGGEEKKTRECMRREKRGEDGKE